MGSPIVPAVLSPKASSLLGIPFASLGAQPRAAPPSAGASREGAPRWGGHSRFHPQVRPPPPDVGDRRARRPRWPRYCFTFPGVYFLLSGKKRDGGRREPELRVPLPGRARRAPNRPGQGLRPDPTAQRAPGPPPLPAPSRGSAPHSVATPRAGRASPILPRRSPLPRRVGRCVDRSAGEHASGDALPPPSRYGTGARPLPSPRPLQLRPLRPGGQSAGRALRPGPEAPPPGPPLPADPETSGWAGGLAGTWLAGAWAWEEARRCHTCRWGGPLEDLDASGVWASSSQS